MPISQALQRTGYGSFQSARGTIRESSAFVGAVRQRAAGPSRPDALGGGGEPMQLRTASILLVACAVACVPYQWFDKVSYYNMAPRLEYEGFSFERPPNRHWYMRQSEESHTQVTLRRDFFLPSDTHSFYARVGLSSIDRQPETHEEFGELARVPPQKAEYEIRNESYEQSLTMRQNQWCIRFDSEHVVLGAPTAPEKELTMRLGGYRCLHPTWPKVTLDFHWSERGLPDEMSSDLAEEGETFLEGVRIDVAPNTPAA